MEGGIRATVVRMHSRSAGVFWSYFSRKQRIRCGPSFSKVRIEGRLGQEFTIGASEGVINIHATMLPKIEEIMQKF